MAKMFLPVQSFGLCSSWRASHHGEGSTEWVYSTPSTQRYTATFEGSTLPMGSTVTTATLTYSVVFSRTTGTFTCRGISYTQSRNIDVKDLIVTDADGHYQDFSVEFLYKASGQRPTGTEPSGTYYSIATVSPCQIEINYTSGTETGYDDEAYMEAALAPARDIRPRGVITYADGAVQPISSDDIVNFEINEGTDKGILLGNALTAQLQLQLANVHGEWLPGGACRGNRAIKGATVTMEIGLMVDGNYMYTPAGVFVIDTISGTENSPVIEVSGYDMMTAVMESQKFNDTLSYPATLQQIFNEIITASSFSVEGSLYVNSAVRLDHKPNWGEECTLRQALAFVMSATASYAFMTRDAKIGVAPAWAGSAEKHLSLTTEHYLSKEYNENSFTFNRITIKPRNGSKDAQNITSAVNPSIAESQSNTIFIDDNPIMTQGWSTNQSIADGIKSGMAGAAWHGLKVEWRGNPSVTIGTRLTLTDTRGVDTVTTIAFQCMRWSKGFSATAECSIDTDETIKAGAVTGGGMLNTHLLAENGIIAYMLSPGSVLTDKLADDAVTGVKIADGAVSADKIEADAVTAEKIDAGAVTADKIDAGAVTAGKIAANAVTADKISSGAVTTGKLDAGAVTTEKLAANSVNAGKIAAGSISSSHISTAGLSAGDIKTGTLAADRIGAGTVSAAKMVAGTITAQSGIIANSAIGTSQIADGSITDAKIVTLTANKLTAGTIDASVISVTNLRADNITAGTINGQRIPVLGTDKVADGAITGAKVAQNAITADKIVSGAVTTDKLAANAVTANKILAGAIETDKLAANAITTDKIAAAQVTASKLAADVGQSLDLSSNTSINLMVSSNPNLIVSQNLDALTPVWKAPTEWVTIPENGYWNGPNLSANTFYTLVYDKLERLSGTVTSFGLSNYLGSNLRSLYAFVYPTESKEHIYMYFPAGERSQPVFYSGHGVDTKPSSYRLKNLRVYSGWIPNTATFYIGRPMVASGGFYASCYKFYKSGTYTLSIGSLLLMNYWQQSDTALLAVVYDFTNSRSITSKGFAYSQDRQSWTFTLEDFGADNVYLLIYGSNNYMASGNTSSYIQAQHIKLEEGEVATVWQESAADIQNRLSEFTVGLDGVKARVSENETDISALELSQGNIELSVKSNLINLIQNSLRRELDARSSSSQYFYAIVATNLKPDTYYSFSAESSSSLTSVTSYTVGFLYSGALYYRVDISVSSSRQEHTLKTPSAGPYSFIVYAGVHGSTAGKHLIVNKIQLVESPTPVAWRPNSDELLNNAITINNEGIDINSDGHVRITAKNSSDSRIEFGQGNDKTFLVDESGNLSAIAGHFDTLNVANGSVLIQGVNVMIQDTRPTKPSGVTNVLWLQPQAGASSKEWSLALPKERNNGTNWYDSAYSKTLYVRNTDTVSASSGITYTLRLPYSRYEGVNETATMSGTLTSGGRTVTFSGKSVTFKVTTEYLDIVVPNQSVNLAATSTTVTINLSLNKIVPGLFICGMAGELVLTESASGSGTSGECKVFWI